MATPAFKLTPDKQFVPKELSEQEAIFLWAHGRPAERRAVRTKQGVKYYWTPAIPAQCTDPRIKLMYATFGGIPVSIGLARKMKRAGNTSDVPDIVLPVQGHAGVPGLYIELKRIKGSYARPTQKEYHKLLREQGYQVEVCRGAQQAIEAIKQYLEISES